MQHELWMDQGLPSFRLAGPMGDAQRALHINATELVWTVNAGSHLEAMTLFYEHMEWGLYTTDFPEVDGESYASPGWE